MFCTNCGKELKPNDRFCANCGCEVKGSQSDSRKYDNVVFNPPFRMEAEKRTAQILKNRGEFNGFKEMAEESSRRTARSKAKMDWNLDGFPESITAQTRKSSFDWDSVIERRNSGRSMGFEKIDLSSTMEHKKVDPEKDAPKAKEAEDKVSLGLPPEDSRVISLEELEKELYDLEEELRTDTARTAKYAPLKDDDIEDSDELNAYLDGINKTKKKEDKLEEEAVENVRNGGPMKWNLEDESVSRAKAARAPMGLVWGIDPDELIAKKKASKAKARKEAKMVWDLEEKKEEPEPEPAPEVKEEPAPQPVPEPVREPEPASAPQPEPVIQSTPEPAPEPVKEPETTAPAYAAPKFIPKTYAEPEYKPLFDNIPEPVKEKEPVEEPIPVPEIHVPEIHVPKPEPVPAYEPAPAPEPVKEPEPAPAEPVSEIEAEYKDMILNDEPEYLEKTRIFDQSEIKERLRRELEEAEREPEELPSEIPYTAPQESRRPLYQSDVIHPWEKPEEVPSEEPEAAEIPQEPETAAEVNEEPAAEEAPVYEEPVTEAEPETAAPEPEAPETAEEPVSEEPVSEEPKPMFYTFSQKNNAFQELLQKERERLENMGADYKPANAEPKAAKIVLDDKKQGFAYEEGGKFVEEVVQPVETAVADLSGDAKPNVSQFKYSFMTDGDWLREMKSANDLESLNKTKLRYSDLFPTPLVKDNDIHEALGLASDDMTEEEKKKRVDDINKIFDEAEEEEEKPKKHVVGNIIMILLILVILFEGSVLAAKLIAPDSGYAHISDAVIEKVLDLFSGKGGGETSTDAAADEINTDAADAGEYPAMISELAASADTIGDVTYSGDLTYDSVPQPAFAGVESMEILGDSVWLEEDGTSTTYAQGIFQTVITYYNEWKNRNTDTAIVGINNLVLGEIRSGENGYYILTETTFASEDGNTQTTYQTCYITVTDDSMFIDEIRTEEVVNG